MHCWKINFSALQELVSRHHQAKSGRRAIGETTQRDDDARIHGELDHFSNEVTNYSQKVDWNARLLSFFSPNFHISFPLPFLLCISKKSIPLSSPFPHPSIHPQLCPLSSTLLWLPLHHSFTSPNYYYSIDFVFIYQFDLKVIQKTRIGLPCKILSVTKF